MLFLLRNKKYDLAIHSEKELLWCHNLYSIQWFYCLTLMIRQREVSVRETDWLYKYQNDYCVWRYYTGKLSFFLIKLIFYSSFRSTENWAKGTEISMYLLPPTCAASTIINIPHQSGTFVTKDEPMLTHHFHPESTVYLGVPLGGVMGLEKWIMTNLPLQHHTK